MEDTHETIWSPAQGVRVLPVMRATFLDIVEAARWMFVDEYFGIVNERNAGELLFGLNDKTRVLPVLIYLQRLTVCKKDIRQLFTPYSYTFLGHNNSSNFGLPRLLRDRRISNIVVSITTCTICVSFRLAFRQSWSSLVLRAHEHTYLALDF